MRKTLVYLKKKLLVTTMFIEIWSIWIEKTNCAPNPMLTSLLKICYFLKNFISLSNLSILTYLGICTLWIYYMHYKISKNWNSKQKFRKKFKQCKVDHFADQKMLFQIDLMFFMKDVWSKFNLMKYYVCCKKKNSLFYVQFGVPILKCDSKKGGVRSLSHFGSKLYALCIDVG